MDLVRLILEFIAKLIQYTAWPVTALVLLLFFRNPIISLLQRIKKVGSGDKFAEFIPFETQKAVSEEIAQRMTVMDGPKMTFWQKEVLRNLVVTELTRQEQLIVILHYHEGMPYEEISATLQLPVSHIRQLHLSIIERLRAKMLQISKEWKGRETPGNKE